MRTMAAIKRKYWVFYSEGRNERRMSQTNDTNPQTIVGHLLEEESADLSAVILAACQKVADQTLTDRVKRNWKSKNKERIERMGLDADEACAAWCHGRTDELAFAIEANVLSTLEDEATDDGEE